MFKKKKRTYIRSFLSDRVYKPGSVIDSHLSSHIVANTVKPPSRKHPGRPDVSSAVLLRIEFAAMDTSAPSGALLPHLSTLTGTKIDRRYISVALFLKLPSAGVTRYPCPAEPGLSSCTAFRRYTRDCPTRSLHYFTLFL